MVRRHALLIGIGSYGEGLLDPSLGGLQPQP